jgi:gluconolactonase
MKPCIEALSTEFKGHLVGQTELRIVASGFRFLEGPAWDSHQNRLFFNDIKGNAVYTWSQDQGISIFRDNSYLANGNTLDHEGNLITCEHGTSRLSMTRRQGDYEVLASSYCGKALNSPNDVIVRSDGLIFFTDPPAGRSAEFGIPRPQELEFQGVYALDPLDGKLTLLVDDFEFPNGLCLSLDERFLLVNDTSRAYIRVFPISVPNTLPNLGPGRIFAELKQDLPGKADGMKFDSSGLLFCTGPGGILAFNESGKVVGRIYVPEQTANFTWGESELKTLFITASTRLYSIRLGVPGLTVPPQAKRLSQNVTE